jgi:hypothetical protein
LIPLRLLGYDPKPSLFWDAAQSFSIPPGSMQGLPAELPLLRSLKIGDKRLLGLLTVPRLELSETKVDIKAGMADALKGLMSRSLCDLQFLFANE